MKRRSWISGLLILLGVLNALEGREVWLMRGHPTEAILGGLRAGDELILEDGVWEDFELTIERSGREGEPIIIRGESPGGVVITGRGGIRIGGDYVEVRGLRFESYLPADGYEALVSFRGEEKEPVVGSRLTENLFLSCNSGNPDERYAWVRLYGKANRVDHNRFEEMDFYGVVIQAMIHEAGAGHRIDHNHFIKRQRGRGNGYEIIQIGQSGDSLKDGNVVIKNNLFDRCDGETEIVSIKTGKNLVEGNQFLRSDGSLTLRHGSDNTVRNNLFVGDHRMGSGGVRLVGSGHVVEGNRFEKLRGRTGGVVVLYHGIEDTPLNGYEAADNAEIRNNYFIRNEGPAIHLNGGAGVRGREIEPSGVVLEGNHFVGSSVGSEMILAGKLSSMSVMKNSRQGGTELGIGSGEQFPEVELSVKDGQPLALSEVGPSWHVPRANWLLWDPLALAKLLRGEDEESHGWREAIMGEAKVRFEAGRFYSVRDNAKIPPSGDPNDYYSTGPYWWPDPESEDGLPYIQRDGQFNPERDLVSDREPLHEMVREVRVAALAWAINGKRKYSRRAIQLLDTWFLDSRTGMNPNLNHAQAIPGRTDGRGTGIIDTLVFVDLFDALNLLQFSPDWETELESGLKDWFRDYLDWLIYSELGMDEASAKNNHGVAYDLQRIGIAAYLGLDSQVKTVLNQSVSNRIEAQIEEDGRQPRELSRTRTWSYSTENLYHFYRLAKIGQGFGVDWLNDGSESGKRLWQALEFLKPYICEPSRWAYEQKTDWQWEFIRPVLTMAKGQANQPNWVRELVNCLPEAPLEEFLRTLIAHEEESMEVFNPSQVLNWDAGVRNGIPTFQKRILISAEELSHNPSEILQQAIDEYEGEGYLQLPVGEFVLNNPIRLKSGVVLTGSGERLTRLVFNREKYRELEGVERPALGAIQLEGTFSRAVYDIKGTVFRGDRKVTVKGGMSELVPGSMILISAENDPELMYTDPRWDVAWARRSMGQIVEIVSVDPVRNEVTLDKPLRLDYLEAFDPQIRVIHPIENAGVENLIVEAMGALDDNLIGIEAARNCWVRNVESINTGRGHIWLNFSRFVTVSRNLCHHANYYGGGGRGYGIVAGNLATDNLFEGNELHHLRHSIMTKRGANGNVFANNYSHTRQRDPEGRPLLCDVSIHGHYSYQNLFKGNLVEYVGLADFWGPTGPGMTFYRNTITDKFLIEDHSHQTIVVENWIGGKGVESDGTSKGLIIKNNRGH